MFIVSPVQVDSADGIQLNNAVRQVILKQNPANSNRLQLTDNKTTL